MSVYAKEVHLRIDCPVIVASIRGSRSWPLDDGSSKVGISWGKTINAIT
jgi:hypothetical protein